MKLPDDCCFSKNSMNPRVAVDIPWIKYIYLYLYIHIYIYICVCVCVCVRDIALKTCQSRWMIGRSGERGSGISVLAGRHDDDDDDDIRTYLCMYVCNWIKLILYFCVHACIVCVCVCVCVCACVCVCVFGCVSVFTRFFFHIIPQETNNAEKIC